jgi:hypothetical protein
MFEMLQGRTPHRTLAWLTTEPPPSYLENEGFLHGEGLEFSSSQCCGTGLGFVCPHLGQGGLPVTSQAFQDRWMKTEILSEASGAVAKPRYLWHGQRMTSTLSAPLLPPEMPPFLPSEEVMLMSAIKCFETGRVSLGQAARMAGYTKGAFIEVLGHHGVAVLDSPAEELAGEIAW